MTHTLPTGTDKGSPVLEFDIPEGVRAVEVETTVLPVIEAAKKVVHFVKPTSAIINWQGVQAVRELAAALDALFEQGIKGPANL